MSLLLPLTGTPERELFDVRHLAEIASPANRDKLPGLMSALRAAVRTIRSDSAIKAVNTFVHRSNGELWLIEVNAEGEWKRQWNFGML